MSTHAASSLWWQIGRESVLGKRGVSKTGSVWFPIAVLLSVRPADDLPGVWVAGLALFAASACRTIGTILANDMCDRAEDAAAGKARWIHRLSPLGAGAVVAGLLGVGLVILGLGGAPPAALGAYLLAIVLGLLYSARPVRLKERGLVGLVSYSLICAIAYVLVPWAWLGSPWYVLAMLGAVVFMDRWVNLHFHQVVDYLADRGASSGTYAVRAGLDTTRRTLRPAAGLAFVCMLGMLVLLGVLLPLSGMVAVVICALAALVAGLYATVAGSRSRDPSSLLRELPPYYLGPTYAIFWVLPPLLLIALALGERGLWVLAGMSMLSSLLATANSVRYRY